MLINLHVFSYTVHQFEMIYYFSVKCYESFYPQTFSRYKMLMTGNAQLLQPTIKMQVNTVGYIIGSPLPPISVVDYVVDLLAP
jgi:hypothetical protein